MALCTKISHKLLINANGPSIMWNVHKIKYKEMTRAHLNKDRSPFQETFLHIPVIIFKLTVAMESLHVVFFSMLARMFPASSLNSNIALRKLPETILIQDPLPL